MSDLVAAVDDPKGYSSHPGWKSLLTRDKCQQKKEGRPWIENGINMNYIKFCFMDSKSHKGIHPHGE